MLENYLACCFSSGIGASKLLDFLRQDPKLTIIPRGVKANWEAVRKALAWREKVDGHILTFLDQEYPKVLRHISSPPPVLFIQGAKEVLQQPQLAIVGSRKASKQGKNNAHWLAVEMVARGFAVTSGLACGIDASAHKGAIQGGGKTIAVLGSGHQCLYPRSNIGLAHEICSSGGAIISEFLPDVPPKPSNFPRRNRIISGLCCGVLIVEAEIKSGSLVTANLALEQGREVFAVPGPIDNKLYSGCHKLIQQGAKLVASTEDVLDELGLSFDCSLKGCKLTQSETDDFEKVGKNTLTSRERGVLGVIAETKLSVAEIVTRSKLSFSEVSSCLQGLELNGYITATPQGEVSIL